MSADLKGQLDGSMRRWRRYPAYSAPGSQWLAELPSHWRLKRLKHVATIQTGLTLGKDYAGRQTIARPYLRVANVQDGYLDLDTITQVSVPAEDVERHELRTGDVLMTEGGDFDKLGRGYVWDGQIEGCLHQNHIFAVRPNRQVLEPHFLAALMTSAHGKNYFTTTSQQTTNLASTNSTKLKNFPLPLPCAEEQRLILGFLGRETVKIDALLAKKERLIELLQEKRTALINHAVTRGLDPSVPVKDSGVGWLGKIPGHWDVSSLGRYVVGIEQGWSPVADDRTAEDGAWGVIKLGAVYKGTFRSTEHKALPAGLAPDERYEVREGDFLLTRANTPDLVGDVCVVRSPRPRLMLCDLVYRVRLNENRINKDFLALWLLSLAGRYQITRDARGSSQSMVKLAQGHICRLTVVLPPINEQEAIVAMLNRESAKVDGLIGKVQQGIERLREYRTALISAAVTGKIDVREEGP